MDYDRVTNFSAADYAGLFHTAALDIDGDWAVGGSVKIIHRSVGKFGKAWDLAPTLASGISLTTFCLE